MQLKLKKLQGVVKWQIQKREQEKNLKVLEGDYIQMKILKILYGIKFATPIGCEKKRLQKCEKVKKPFARKIQILTVGEQRAKVMGKTEVANIFKKGKSKYKEK
jgi:hypothetical protein